MVCYVTPGSLLSSQLSTFRTELTESGFTLLQKERIDMSLLYSILDLTIIVVISVGVAGLVVSLGKWKIRIALLRRFKSLTMSNPYERRGISEHSVARESATHAATDAEVV
jgi:hypothetical protein